MLCSVAQPYDSFALPDIRSETASASKRTLCRLRRRTVAAPAGTARHEFPVDREAKRASRSQCALQPDRSFVGLDDALHARQAHALALHVLRLRVFSPAEDEEDLVHVLGVHAAARVLHVK